MSTVRPAPALRAHGRPEPARTVHGATTLDLAGRALQLRRWLDVTWTELIVDPSHASEATAR